VRRTLNYFNAQIRVEDRDEVIHYSALRKGGGAHLEASYRPASDPYESQPGTLEHWLTERYCLYARAPDGTIWRNEVHHAPWPLQRAEATFSGNTYLLSHGVAVEGPPATLHFARRLDVVVWPAERAA
jgi:uncharacterized protein YqjF (DUF2071 family)